MEEVETGFKYHLINIIQILGFSICGLFVLLVLNGVFKPQNHNAESVAGFYGEEKNTLDMVYLGGSAAFVFWQPLTAYEEAGIASYDFASDTIQAELYSYMIKEVLKTQDPELFVIDARAFSYRDSVKPPDGVAYRNVLSYTPISLEREQLIQEIVPKYLDETEDILSYHFDIGLYHTRFNELPYDIDFQLMAFTGNYQNPDKGFWTVPTDTVRLLKKNEFKTNEKTALSDNTEAILDELINDLKKTNKKALFIVSSYNETKEHKKIYNFVEEKAKEAGFDFLDTNEYADEIGLDFKTDFYNDAHVNLYGSNKYTDFLVKYIKEKYNLPDRRGENKYESWDALLNGWHDHKKTLAEEIEKELVKKGVK